MRQMMDSNGNVVYWLPSYANLNRFKEYNPAGYPYKLFLRKILPEWLRLRGAI